MSRNRLICLVVTAFISTMTLMARPLPDAVSTTGEVRGLWVLRSTLTSPGSITAMIRTAKAAGFNTLLVQVRGRGEAFYRSDIEPRATDLDAQPASFDPLAVTIDLAHREGMRVHAWVNISLVASATTLPRSVDHIALRHPEWLMVPRALLPAIRRTDVRSPAYIGTLARWSRTPANSAEGLFLSAIVPAAQDHTVSVIRELATRYELDGIHFDYLRFPSTEFDYGAVALAEFRSSVVRTATAIERQRLDAAAASDAAIWTKTYPAAWSAFRHERMTALVSRLSAAVRAARPAALVSSAVFPESSVASAERVQNWPAWAAAGLLDVVCPMIYTPDTGEFTAQVRQARTSLGTTPLWAGIGAYRLPVSATAENVRSARRAGAAGILLFSYDSLTSAASPAREYLTAIRPVLLEADGPRSHH